jgi:hypothetical protein
MIDRDEETEIVGGALERFQSSAEIAGLEAQTRGEIDIQIATAKRYPRSMTRFLENAKTLATMTPEVAASCTYAKPAGRDMLTGPSIRLAEIVLSCWGNVSAGARVIDQDAKFLTAQGVCFDLESNVRTSIEVRRRITDRNGRTYSDDMIATTANAACSIALRNAIFRIVPKSLVEQVRLKAQEVSRGGLSLVELRPKMLEHFARLGVSPARIFDRIGVKGADDITLEHVDLLRAIATGIQDRETTVDTAFPEPVPEGVAGAIERARNGTGTRGEVLDEAIKARGKGKGSPEPAPDPQPPA